MSEDKNFMVYLLALATFASTYLGGLFTLKYRDRLHRILGFASGVLLGAVFFDLLPEAIRLAGPQGLIHVMFSLVVGFLFFHLLQRLFFVHSCPEEDQGDRPHYHAGQMGAGTFIIHSFFDGLAIGVAFQVGHPVGYLVAVAVIAHDFSDGLNTVSLLLRHRVHEKKVKLWLWADALAPLMGVLAAQSVSLSQTMLSFLLATFAGFFLYIATADLLPETHHEHNQVQTVGATLLGAALMFAVACLMK